MERGFTFTDLDARIFEDFLKIRFRPEVLPFRNIPAYLLPYLLAPYEVVRMMVG